MASTIYDAACFNQGLKNLITDPAEVDEAQQQNGNALATQLFSGQGRGLHNLHADRLHAQLPGFYGRPRLTNQARR